MKILILGDVMGPSGRKAIKKNLSKIINDNKIDFTFMVPAGENAYIPIRFFETWMKSVVNEDTNDAKSKSYHYELNYLVLYQYHILIILQYNFSLTIEHV